MVVFAVVGGWGKVVVAVVGGWGKVVVPVVVLLAGFTEEVPTIYLFVPIFWSDGRIAPNTFPFRPLTSHELKNYHPGLLEIIHS